MRRLAALFERLDATRSTRAKTEALVEYFRGAPPADAAWGVYVLMGRRMKRCVGAAALRQWLTEESALPAWLVEETYASVGDLAETVALLLADRTAAPAESVPLAEWFEWRLQPLAALPASEQRALVTGWWRELPYLECLLATKLLTGALRVGVSRSLVTRALADCLDVERVGVERALMGEWTPSAAFFESLARPAAVAHPDQPYPFHLASPLEGAPDALGARERWIAEWKWDGIRAQVVRRAGSIAIWSRGEESVAERFPEIVAAAAALPQGTVLDGEVLAWDGRGVLPFASLQRRIGRKAPGAKIQRDIPVRYLAYDLLEADGADLRARPLAERRARLESLVREATAVAGGPGAGGWSAIDVSPVLPCGSWGDLAAAREQARVRGVEGLMLKDAESVYRAGRQRGAWWKWKLDPLTFDGVLLYAAPGHGRRSNLYTDYTFGVWRDDALVPVAKAYSGLTDAEIRDLDRWIRAHTREKFGVVRSVEPLQVFELAYEGIAASTRHKSGVALRFPRILRWRTDKPAREADTLAALRAVLEAPRG